MHPVTHEFETRATARAAYDAVATAAGIKGWWAKVGTVAEEVGGATELRFDKEGRIVVMKFTVDALDPYRAVRWTCTENGNPAWKGSTLAWTIEDAGDRRIVRFEHAGFAQGGQPYEMTVEGWKFFIASLQSNIEGRGGNPSG